MDTMSAEVDAVHTEAADAAVLVVSELVTNALRHGGGRFGWPRHGVARMHEKRAPDRRFRRSGALLRSGA